MSDDAQRPAAADGGSTEPSQGYTPNDPKGVDPSSWVVKIVVVIVLVGMAYVAYRMAAAFFPRWWAQRLGNQIDGRITAGTLWGLFYGFLFTVIPLLLLFQVRRRFLSWAWRGVVAVVAVALAAPNWLTLAVVAGNSRAAHAAERILDNDAPGFRWATLWGVVLGAVVALGLTALSMQLTHRKKQVKRLKSERDELKARDHVADGEPAEDASPNA